MIELAYAYAKGMYMTGGVEGRRQLVNLYLDKIVVYKEHIEFFLNTLPVSILKQEVSRATEELDGGDNLLTYMVKNDANFIENMVHANRRRMIFKEKYEASETDASGYIKNQEKKVDNRPETGKLSTFIGGGEGVMPPSTQEKNEHLLRLIDLMTVTESREEINNYKYKPDVIFTYLPHLKGQILIGR